MSYRQERFPGARRVLAQDAVPRYDLRRTLMARMLADNPALSVLLLFGDVEMEQLDLDPRGDADHGAVASFARSEPDVHGLVIAGNLLVHGAVHHLSAPMGLSLYVLGSLRARTVAVSGLELVVRDDVRVRDVLCGSGPHGGARLDGDVDAKLLVSDGFPVLVGGRLKAPVLATPNGRVGIADGGRVRAEPGDVPPDLVLTDAVREPTDEGGGFSFDGMRAAVAAGRPVLRADYLSGRVDLAGLRELRRLDGEIEASVDAGDHAGSLALIRRALAAGAPADPLRLPLADALYHLNDQPSGDPDAQREALELLDAALGTHPDAATVIAHPQALVARADILLQLREDDDDAFEQAWRDCGLAAVTLPPTDRARVAALMGRWLFTRRRYGDSVPYLRQAVAADPDDARLQGRLATALWMVDREEEALAPASRCLELDPSDERMWFVRGTCHRALGRLAEARHDLQTHLRAHPDDELAVQALVEVGLDQGHTELAVQRAVRFVEENPQLDGAPARFGRLLHRRGLHARAVRLLQRAVERDPDDRSAVVDLAVAIEDAGAERPGLVTALRALEVDTGSEHLAYLRAECWLALGDLSRAEPELVDYLVRVPDAGRALASMAGVRLAQGRERDADALLDRAHRAAPDDLYVEELTERRTLDLGATLDDPTPGAMTGGTTGGTTDADDGSPEAPSPAALDPTSPVAVGGAPGRHASPAGQRG